MINETIQATLNKTGKGKIFFITDPHFGHTNLCKALRGMTAEGVRLLAWRFYWVRGEITPSGYASKLQGALGRISGWGDDGANIVIYTPLSDAKESEADAAARLQSYLDSQGDALVAALQQTRGRD